MSDRRALPGDALEGEALEGEALHGDSLGVAVPARALLGEGPVWDPVAERLLWVDILAREVRRLDPRTGQEDLWRMPSLVSAVLPARGGGVVVALEDEIAAAERWGGPLVTLARPSGLADGARFNDAACDPQGRLWAGTLTEDRTPGACALYRLDPGGELVTVLEGVTLSNGLGWSPDGRTLYYADTETHRVDAFDFEPATGDLSRRRPLAEIDPAVGRPDGLAVDSEGAVWVCVVGAGLLQRYLPDGSLEREIALPATKVTSCAFGGPDLATLFVTSASVGMSEKELRAQPRAGDLLRLRPGVAGLALAPWSG